MRKVLVYGLEDHDQLLDFSEFAIIPDTGVVVTIDGDREILYPWHRVAQVIVPKGEISGGQLA